MQLVINRKLQDFCYGKSYLDGQHEAVFYIKPWMEDYHIIFIVCSICNKSLGMGLRTPKSCWPMQDQIDTLMIALANLKCRHKTHGNQKAPNGFKDL